jgi:hypothetical protein
MHSLARQVRRVQGIVLTLLAAVIFVLCQLPAAPTPLTPDSTEYLLHTLTISGLTADHARLEAERAFCSGQDPQRLLSLTPSGATPPDGAKAVAACEKRLRGEYARPHDTKFGPAITTGQVIQSKRYEDIFASRPGIAAMFLPGVSLWGPRWGMWATVLVCTIIGGLLTYALLRLLGIRPVPAVSGPVLYFLLPTAKWSMLPLGEAPALALSLAVLIGGVLIAQGRHQPGMAIFVSAMAIGFFVKNSQFMLLGLGIATGAAITARATSTARRSLVVLASTGLAAALLELAGTKLMGWPGVGETLQDLLTSHFAKPDVADPYLGWIAASVHFWAWWLVQQANAPLVVVIWVAAGWTLIRYRARLGLVFLGAALTGLLGQAAHPAPQADRLYVLMWIMVIVAVPLLIDEMARRSPTDKPERLARTAETPVRELSSAGASRRPEVSAPAEHVGVR